MAFGRISAVPSGIVVSTGAGSTGWLRSVATGALEVVRALCPEVADLPAAINCRTAWSAEWLRFAVREPFASSRTQAGVVFGTIGKGQRLRIVSRMPEGGVIFSDSVLEDALAFHSRSVAEAVVSERKAKLMAALASGQSLSMSLARGWAQPRPSDQGPPDSVAHTPGAGNGRWAS